MAKWLAIFVKPNSYKGLEDILHFALCCFIKSPLEATAETIGSIINQHGRKQRYSLAPSSLSNEVQIAWNGPSEFAPELDGIIEDAVENYFSDKHDGVRFYVESKFKLISKTVAPRPPKPSGCGPFRY